MPETRVARLGQPPFWLSVIELLKPVTWFPPMWAFACGVVASGVTVSSRLQFLIGGVLLAGPFLCGTSQVVNDWFDRHVDALNQPNRPIPSGRIPGRLGLHLAVVWSILSMLLAALLGTWVFVASALGLALAWAYSAPPFRLKRNGWWGNAAVGLCYESLPWFTAAAAMSGGLPDTRLIVVALLYGAGAHGIMTLNDFKSIEGDRAMGLRSLPAALGPDRAARLACVVMAVPQLAVIGLLLQWQQVPFALGVLGVLLGQIALMPRMLSDPERFAPWYNGTGIVLYVSGMMISAFALRGLL
ncbi:MAG: chlorophyll synthase ChlG [Pseudomonadota bacterium]